MNWNKLRLKKFVKSQAVKNEWIKFTPNYSITIYAAKPSKNYLIPLKIIITHDSFVILELQNRKMIKLSMPRILKLRIAQAAENYIISIYYFNTLIVTFNWYDVSQIPFLTDKLMDILKVDYHTTKQIYNNTEELVFHSRIGNKTHQIFKLRDNKNACHLDFQDQIRTKLTFDWQLFRLRLENLKLQNKVEISFIDIDKINFVLRESQQHHDFDLLLITIESKGFGIKQLVNVETIFNNQFEPKSLFKINPKLTFNTVQNVVDLLKSKVELAEVEIEFNVV